MSLTCMWMFELLRTHTAVLCSSRVSWGLGALCQYTAQCRSESSLCFRMLSSTSRSLYQPNGKWVSHLSGSLWTDAFMQQSWTGTFTSFSPWYLRYMKYLPDLCCSFGCPLAFSLFTKAGNTYVGIKLSCNQTQQSGWYHYLPRAFKQLLMLRKVLSSIGRCPFWSYATELKFNSSSHFQKSIRLSLKQWNKITRPWCIPVSI